MSALCFCLIRDLLLWGPRDWRLVGLTVNETINEWFNGGVGGGLYNERNEQEINPSSGGVYFTQQQSALYGDSFFHLSLGNYNFKNL